MIESNILSKCSWIKINSYWSFDVSQTASYEITLIHLAVCPPVGPSVTKFSQDLVISLFRYCT